ncbi:zinc finger protein basonuclin-1 [Chanos chanos]|uniref:Zinc finger protein basonuclin-1 n=1 Tax=Chanos chanos TaxID=29144 RepID=A0A6J2WXY3_CHACN|nr:zinc finger protein basonuclin-1 [Chanos chanos]
MRTLCNSHILAKGPRLLQAALLKVAICELGSSLTSLDLLRGDMHLLSRTIGVLSSGLTAGPRLKAAWHVLVPAFFTLDWKHMLGTIETVLACGSQAASYTSGSAWPSFQFHQPPLPAPPTPMPPPSSCPLITALRQAAGDVIKSAVDEGMVKKLFDNPILGPAKVCDRWKAFEAGGRGLRAGAGGFLRRLCFRGNTVQQIELFVCHDVLSCWMLLVRPVGEEGECERSTDSPGQSRGQAEGRAEGECGHICALLSLLRTEADLRMTAVSAPFTQAICCTLVNCNCDGFKPGKLKRRQCEHCKHGWVAHALSKLRVHHLYQGSQVEIVHSNVVFDICSLMLYGTQAIPVRLKILLDRLFSVLKQEEVIQILNALDWTLQDYIRGYVLQDVAGKVLDRWVIMTFEEEIATLQQFLRFGETKSIVELMALQDKEGQAVIVPSTRTNSDIRTFIESCTQRGASLPTKAEKLSTSNVHHFENFVNSMAFMLPYQLLNSVPAPLLGSHPESLPLEVPQRHSSLLGSSSASFTSDLERNDNTLDGSVTKMEAEDFPMSDNCSDGPSTPCTPSISSDITQMSPDTKMRSLEKNGGSLKKGRVFCTACEKTFYDKGTLKIHYNAVHLKIKHKCTIEGCNMVFSSLRSRNRHSANPNPRLHMPMNRNNRDKDLRTSLSPHEGKDGDKHTEFGAMGSSETRSVPNYIINNSDSKLQSNFPSISQSGILFPNLKTVQPVLPFYRSLVTPAELANTPGNLPSLPLVSSSVPGNPPVMDASSEPAPKKKSRKSSMPIKIEKEAVQSVEELADDSGSEDEAHLAGAEKSRCDADAQVGVKAAAPGCEEHMPVHSADRENVSSTLKRLFDSSSANAEQYFGSQEEDRQEQGQGRGHEGSVITTSSPSDTKQRDVHSITRGSAQHESDAFVSKPSADKPCSDVYEEGDHRAANGTSFRKPAGEREASEICLDNYSDHHIQMDPQAVSSGDKDDMPHHCEICSKTFKNPYSVKMHYRNVHLKEMHMCTVEGCNAAFPSRRSRDRHSANLNLHHKLLTKDHFGASSTIYSSSSLCRDIASDFRHDFLPKESTAQTSVIFKGNNRMGLVFPMSKAATESSDGPVGVQGEDEAVLDLSTTSVSRSGGSGHSSWDSDGGSEEGLPLGDSDESCDGLSLVSGEGPTQESGEKSPGCLGQQIQGGSPITCHVCHKVYSNKGTFRAHYKTVHLRLLHKCKVPGCETTFSSVRSRNRHSQNPNLHRNLAASTALGQE